jgi:GTP-binding protein YchF
MRFGITGLPKTGKTTLFNLLCGAELDTSKFAATREEVHVGVGHVPEPRLKRLAMFEKSVKLVEASIEFLDFAGLGFGAEKESKLIGDLRTVDALIHVVRAFEDPELPHPAGSIDPARDVAAAEADMIVNDLIVVENRLPRLEGTLAKARTDDLAREKQVLEKVKAALESETPLREAGLDEEEAKVIKGFRFLSAKPLLLALNLGEDEASDLEAAPVRWKMTGFAEKPGIGTCPLSLALELEVARLDPADRSEFMRELGLKNPGSERLLHSAYSLLNLITFFTGNEKEARAWPLAKGASALEAAATVHTDIARGFIRAEVIPLDDLVSAGSWAEARKLGALRLEGKEYLVQDGDVINIRFNV